MIQFPNNAVEAWNKKIIYAPNGFGKTTCANRLNRRLISTKENPVLFTRRQIEDLVKFSSNAIHVGPTAESSAEMADEISRYQEEKPLLLFFKNENYPDFKKPLELRKNSFLLASINFKSYSQFDSAVLLYKKAEKVNHLPPLYGFRETVDIDKKIDHRLASQSARVSSLLVDPKNPIEESLQLGRQLQRRISDLRQEIHQQLYGGMEETKLTYQHTLDSMMSNDDIGGLIDRYQHSVIDQKPFLKLYELFREIISSIQDGPLRIWEGTIRPYIGQRPINKVATVLCYQELCNYNNSLLSSQILKRGNPSYSFGDEVGRYIANQRIVAKGNQSINDAVLSQFVVREFKTISFQDPKIKIKVNKDGGIQIRNNGSTVHEDPYHFFSESEIKRLALCVLMGVVRYKEINYVVLDDPIDSYDDYYLLVACQYIAKLLTNKIYKLKGWYIFTNSFSALYCLCKFINPVNILIFNWNPSNVFTGKNTLISFDAKNEDVENANKNEIMLLSTLIDQQKENPVFDPKLGLIALSLPLRGLTDYFPAKFSHINFTNAIENKEIGNPLFPNEFSEQITRCFFHYAPAGLEENAKNSDNLLVKDVANLFAKTSGATGSSFMDFTNSNQKAASFRTKVLKSAKREGSKLINLTLVKIGLIQEEKFQLEKEMIDGLMKRGIPKEDVLEIVNTHSFGRKLNTAKKKAKNKPVQLEFLKRVEKVFQENRIMFNYFDHALSNMLPPYLATSILDIQQFKIMVDSLKDEGKNG